MPSSRAQVRWAALSVLPGAACSADVAAPTLEDAAFVDASTVRLRYSEPLASVDEVDPSSHFRLSAAFVLADQDLTVYYDLSYHFLAGGPAQGGPPPSWPRHGNAEVIDVQRGDDASELLLTLAYPVEHYLCDELLEAAALDIPAAIHLHYAEADAPRITDEAGNPVADDGAWWVPVPGTLTTQPGALPELSSTVTLGCPGSQP